MPGTILLVDDEEKLRKLLARIISLEGFVVIEAPTLKAAAGLLQQHEVEVVLCDVKLPDGNGVDFVRTVRSQFPLLQIILLTAYGNVPDGVQAIKNGAFDYIMKGDDNDRILPLLHQAMEKANLQKRSAIKISGDTNAGFNQVIGTSQIITDAVKLAASAAVTDATIVLLGETGTGKEVFANVIHHNSRRKDRALVAINCSAFTRELLEGELFGHKAGAYTGAVKDKKGLFEVADGGTLFLDEIGELDIDLQAKLLRVLENGEFIKLGDTKISKVNVRVIAATNRELQQEMSKGNFRQDLYYRLSVFTIELPPLRQRVEDIPALVAHFLAGFSKKDALPVVPVSKTAMQLLQQYTWKGNIRELKNVLERALILANGIEILPEHLPYDIQKQVSSNLPELSLAAVEKQHIQKILQHTKGNKAKAARLLQIGLATLYRKIEEYRIDVNE